MEVLCSVDKVIVVVVYWVNTTNFVEFDGPTLRPCFTSKFACSDAQEYDCTILSVVGNHVLTIHSHT